MMIRIIYLVFALCTTIGTAQSKYEQGMQKAFELWNANKLDEASNLFERISNAEKDNWLPDYYVGQIKVLNCWNNFQKRDESLFKANLDKAQEHLNNILAIDKDNPYAKQLQAQIYTVWVAYDGMKYGMKYAGKVSELYAQALAQEPENPIFIFNKAEWDMGSARFMGGDTSKYCADIKKSIDLFATFKPETQFHPSYGLERAQKVYEQCGK